MAKIEIQIDLNSLSNIVQRQTRNFCYEALSVTGIRVNARDQKHREFVIDPLKKRLRELKNTNDKLVYISEILKYVGKLLNENEEVKSDLDAIELLQDIQFLFVRELESMNIGVDKNAFSNEEIEELDRKINKIIDKLDEIGVGHEVIFDRIEELKGDYEDLLKSAGLGKKPFLQRIAGIGAAYVGEKGADEVFGIIRPLVRDAIENTAKFLVGS